METFESLKRQIASFITTCLCHKRNDERPICGDHTNLCMFLLIVNSKSMGSQELLWEGEFMLVN